ncbi:uncharacterized protein TNCV_2485441 [Trichonephila clavipes]|uniref:Uncharacterized protein n=1 Tax=Trichonephila clavipes TaxID=2585209 RepID=A0A8X6VZT1_TRICX|nr:uncharacterized protein TNCV_2485441 [Trichonephila clavipes]
MWMCFHVVVVSDRGPRNSSWQEAKLHLSLSAALSTIQMAVQFGCVPPQFRGRIHPGGGQRPAASLSFPPSSREDICLDECLECSRAAKALYIYKHSCIFRDLDLDPTTQQPVPLATTADSFVTVAKSWVVLSESSRMLKYCFQNNKLSSKIMVIRHSWNKKLFLNMQGDLEFNHKIQRVGSIGTTNPHRIWGSESSFVGDQKAWFMQDVAPAHFSIAVRNHPYATYPGSRIGRGEPVTWPPRSPDLNSLHFFSWGHLKSLE